MWGEKEVSITKFNVQKCAKEITATGGIEWTIFSMIHYVYWGHMTPIAHIMHKFKIFGLRNHEEKNYLCSRFCTSH